MGYFRFSIYRDIRYISGYMKKWYLMFQDESGSRFWWDLITDFCVYEYTTVFLLFFKSDPGIFPGRPGSFFGGPEKVPAVQNWSIFWSFQKQGHK